jgi:hypothetical protein
MDIIGKKDDACGYLAESKEDYVEFVVRAMTKFDNKFHK